MTRFARFAAALAAGFIVGGLAYNTLKPPFIALVLAVLAYSTVTAFVPVKRAPTP